jgi:hypothetical protein
MMVLMMRSSLVFTLFLTVSAITLTKTSSKIATDAYDNSQPPLYQSRSINQHQHLLRRTLQTDEDEIVKKDDSNGNNNREKIGEPVLRITTLQTDGDEIVKKDDSNGNNNREKIGEPVILYPVRDYTKIKKDFTTTETVASKSINAILNGEADAVDSHSKNRIETSSIIMYSIIGVVLSLLLCFIICCSCGGSDQCRGYPLCSRRQSKSSTNNNDTEEEYEEKNQDTEYADVNNCDDFDKRSEEENNLNQSADDTTSDDDDDDDDDDHMQIDHDNNNGDGQIDKDNEDDVDNEMSPSARELHEHEHMRIHSTKPPRYPSKNNISNNNNTRRNQSLLSSSNINSSFGWLFSSTGYGEDVGSKRETYSYDLERTYNNNDCEI